MRLALLLALLPTPALAHLADQAHAHPHGLELTALGALALALAVWRWAR